MTKSKHVALVRNFLNSPRCGARTKRNNHEPCMAPAMANGRCRMHGGKSTGPKTEEGKKKSAMANYKYGHYTKEAISERKRMSMMMRWRDDLEGV